jgi:aminoglycoside 6'-N-acetyltransferase I
MTVDRLWEFAPKQTQNPDAEDMMHVRRVRPDDAAEWKRMRDVLWPGISAMTHETDMAEFLRNETNQAVFVIDRETGLLGGFLETGTRKNADGCETSPVGYIEGWYVDPDLRQAGWGRALVMAAEVWCRSCGYAEIASDCLHDNEVSLDAHIALGYEETDRLIHFRKSLAADVCDVPRRNPPPGGAERSRIVRPTECLSRRGWASPRS